MSRAIGLGVFLFLLVPLLAFIDEASADQYHEVYLHPQGTIPSYVTPDRENDVELVSTGYFYYNYLTERQSKNIQADGIVSIIDSPWILEITPMSFYGLEPNEKAVFIIRIIVPKGVESGTLGFFRLSVTTQDNLGYSDTDTENIHIQVGMYDEVITEPEVGDSVEVSEFSIPWWGFASVGALIAIIVASIIVIYRFSTMDGEDN